MPYELKKYIPHPGQGPALKRRFAEVTMPLFARFGIELLHCFEDPAEPEALYYLTRFDTIEQRDAAMAAFLASPEWKAAKAASEVDGPLLASQTTLALHPTAFSPERSAE